MAIKMADPAIGLLVASDEVQFLDQSLMVMFLVDERRTASEELSTSTSG